MFNSIFSQRWLKWISGPKKYVVNLEIRIGQNYRFKDVEVVAHCKSEAFEKAKLKMRDSIEIVVKGSKTLGRVKSFDEF